MAAEGCNFAFVSDPTSEKITPLAMSASFDDGSSNARYMPLINTVRQAGDLVVKPKTLSLSTKLRSTALSVALADTILRARPNFIEKYGLFGGRFAPESIMCFLHYLRGCFTTAISEPSFWAEFAALHRSTALDQSTKLTALGGGATIWLKREDQGPFGSHKVRNIIGQLLLARRMGRTEVVTDCGSAKHGAFTAYMCSRLNLDCVVVMGADDKVSQKEGVLKMKHFGAKVITARAPSGMGSMRAAMAEAFRYLVCNHETTFYLAGGPVGPSPLPAMNATFQAILGREVEDRLREKTGCLPDAVVAAVGSGNGAIGLFHPFVGHRGIRRIGVQAVRAATLVQGEAGVLYGAHTLLLQDANGQVLDAHSIAPDLNLSTVGPEIAYWSSSGLIDVVTATDEDAHTGLEILRDHENMSPGLDCCHAVRKTLQVARQLGEGKNIVLLVTGDDDGGQNGRQKDSK